MIQTKTKLLKLIAGGTIWSLIVGCGTIGNIGDDLYFPVSKRNLELAMDSLYANYPIYKIPPKWVKYDDWSKNGYDFLESRIFYFKTPPEEMYYVTFITDSISMADSSQIGIGVRAVFNGNLKEKKWWLLGDDLSSNERERITKRFNSEIISKLEKYTKAKASSDRLK
jgi:hypothetical protein